MNKFVKATVLASVVAMAGCASILSNSQYPVVLKTTPSGASFKIVNKDGQVIHSGVTPSTVTLKSGRGFFSGERYTVTYRKAGFNDVTTVIDSTLDGWYLGNLLFGGLIGLLVVDPATGAMWALPKEDNGFLSENSMTGKPGEPLKVTTIDQVSKDDQNRLVKVN